MTADDLDQKLTCATIGSVLTIDQVTHRKRNWIVKATIITAIMAWVLANALDVLSVLFFLQQGGRPALVELMARHRPAELALIYAGVRTLGTLAVCLFVAMVHKHWVSASQVLWSTLTAFALVTAVTAWIRIAQVF